MFQRNPHVVRHFKAHPARPALDAGAGQETRRHRVGVRFLRPATFLPSVQTNCWDIPRKMAPAALPVLTWRETPSPVSLLLLGSRECRTQFVHESYLMRRT